jgi:hypothetical protein
LSFHNKNEKGDRVMRTNLLALFFASVSSIAIAQSTGTPGADGTITSEMPATSSEAVIAQTSGPSSSNGTAAATAPSTTAGQTTAGATTSGQSLTKQTAPAPIVTTPPINPAPQTSSASSKSSKRLPNPGHRSMGTANSYQNGEFGTVKSNSVITGGTNSNPVLSTTPAISNNNPSVIQQQMNGPTSAPGTLAQPTAAAAPAKSTANSTNKKTPH